MISLDIRIFNMYQFKFPLEIFGFLFLVLIKLLKDDYL